MQPGDIIVMDEPATHLHVQGQQELRKFLKDFTIKTGVTIVLATHSPFLVDMDNLDELRIVKNIHGRTSIQNDFSAIDANDSDTLSSVIKALTVKTHILSDPDKQMVFVEGITDYNTLTKAVRLLGEEYQNISFIPVNGIGKDKEQQREVLRKILEIGRKRNPILLVDGDKAGEAIKKLNGENKDLLVISLSEIDPEFKEIEALFVESDRIKLGTQKENGKYVKSSILSSNIKNYSKDKDFSDETKSNFKKVLDYIIEQSS
jgi:predicted ATP-dependent endonuclease of OLD family